MSKNITIQESGVAKNFTGVTHIRTQGISSGDTDWVPEDEQGTGIKYITENGIYDASDDNLKGYVAVLVNVPPTQVTGVDPSTGNRVTVTTDNEGNLLYLPADATTEFD